MEDELKKLSMCQDFDRYQGTIRSCFELALEQEAGSHLKSLIANQARPADSMIQDDRQLGIPDHLQACTFPERQIHTQKWGEWYPGLDTDDCTLGEILDSLPGVSEQQLPKILFQYEDPRSPEAFIGAVPLERHDIIHVLLGRGLLDQDEAFVLGFTMGTCRGGAPDEQVRAMLEALTRKYPEPYRISNSKAAAFTLGIRCAEEMTGCRDIFGAELEAEKFGGVSIGELRRQFGIDRKSLKQYYRKEALEIPDSLESARLPKDG